jgi:Ca-activated chloride channel family protein
VLDLARGEFVVDDDGERQELLTFARGDVPLTAAVLVDASASMEGRRLRVAVRGAGAFLQGLTPADQASILLFSDRLLHATPFSSDPAILTSGLAGVRAGGGTALNDHLYLALKRLEQQKGRRVLLLLSDGIDSHSALTSSEVRWLAQRSRALIYLIRRGGPPAPHQSRFSSWKGPRRYQDEHRLLTRAVRDSGGRIVTLTDIEETEQAVRGILQELREQYVLGYHPSTARNDGRWREVQVQVRRSGLRVRTRGGYIDY